MEMTETGLITGACILVAAIVVCIIIWCIWNHKQRKENHVTESGNGRPYICDSYDVEAQRFTHRPTISNSYLASGSFSEHSDIQRLFDETRNRSTHWPVKQNTRSNQPVSSNQQYRLQNGLQNGSNRNQFSQVQASSGVQSIRGNVVQANRTLYQQNRLPVSERSETLVHVSETASKKITRSQTKQPHNNQQQEIFSSNKSNEIEVLDLHELTLKKAMKVFKNFLEDSIDEYRESNYRRNKRFIEVITGRGIHSAGGRPVIKPAVANYLKVHDYKYTWSNPGRVRIDLASTKDDEDC